MAISWHSMRGGLLPAFLALCLQVHSFAQEQGLVRAVADPDFLPLEFTTYQDAAPQQAAVVPEPKVNPEIEEVPRQDALTPLQNRDLSPKVAIVDLSSARIGTGMVPDSASEARSQPARMLPDGVDRGAPPQVAYWRPSCICYFPLYFEDAMLERHGHVRFGHAQPLASGAKFFSTISLLPYLKTLRPTCECVYAVGHYRPGSCAPPLRDHLPWDRRAAVVETLSAASFFWAAPL